MKQYQKNYLNKSAFYLFKNKSPDVLINLQNL